MKRSPKRFAKAIVMVAALLLLVAASGIAVLAFSKPSSVNDAGSNSQELGTCEIPRTDGLIVISSRVPYSSLFERYELERFITTRLKLGYPVFVSIVGQTSPTTSSIETKKSQSSYTVCKNDAEKNEPLFFTESKLSVVNEVIWNSHNLPQFDQVGSAIEIQQECLPTTEGWSAHYQDSDGSNPYVETLNEKNDYCLDPNKTYLVFGAPREPEGSARNAETGMPELMSYRSVYLIKDLIFEHVSGPTSSGSYKRIVTGEIYTVDQIRQQIADVLGVDVNSLRPSPATAAPEFSSPTATSSSTSLLSPAITTTVPVTSSSITPGSN